MRKVILLTSILAASAAQGNILYNGGTATENFNSIPVTNSDSRVTLTGTNVLNNQLDVPGLPGWQLARVGGSTTGNIAMWEASAGAGGRFYAYGDGSNRSLGMLASGTAIGAFGVSYVNNTADTFNQVTITYTRQIWHVQGTSNATEQYETRFLFSYGTSAAGISSSDYISNSNMTSFPALDAISPEENTVNSTVSGTDPDRQRFGASPQWSEVVTATINGVDWAPGETLFLRWVDFDAPGFDAGMSIDDFSMTAVIPEPSTVALSMGLLAGLGVWLRRRKN